MAALGIILVFVVPAFAEIFVLFELTIFIVMSILALSLALVWGFGGILCFGQSTFFGLGAYTYAVAVINLGESTLPIFLAILIPIFVAVVLGYFMFWGRVSDVYLAVITLAVSLIFYYLVGASAGSEYKIGKALLGGYNGMPSVPAINVPGFPKWEIVYGDLYILAASVLVVVYFGLRWFLSSDFGHVVVSIRENEARTELLGYDARRYKLIVFALGAGLAGLAGVLFTAWGGYVSPPVFSMIFTAEIIIWILVGGLGTLLGAIVGCVLIQSGSTWLGETKLADINLILGAVFVLLVLFIPKGIVPMAREQFIKYSKLFGLMGKRSDRV
ncbi:MAG: branched-chain amino acid ABC transporter permease [Chloroflexi bacterium]|nr:branched-chain amino acid ABC transporter permease [Chloroflexota bacterium]